VKTITDTLGISRSNVYEKREKGRTPRQRRYRKADDDFYLPLIREIVDARTTYGYPRATALLNSRLAGMGRLPVNRKRVHRIMEINNLLLPKHTGRPFRMHDGKIATLESNMRWCSDVFAIQCWNGETVWVAFSLDCCDREVVNYIATTGGVSGEMIRDLMAETIESRFGLVDHLPRRVEWLSDNGSAYTARETRNFAASMGLVVCTTPVRSPESNGMAEGFVKTFKRDYVHVNRLENARMVLGQLPGWFEDYNEVAPHKGLKMRSPREYRKSLMAASGCPV
jgi:transposase InsO family protein